MGLICHCVFLGMYAFTTSVEHKISDLGKWLEKGYHILGSNVNDLRNNSYEARDVITFLSSTICLVG